MMRNAIEAAKGANTRLVFFDNVYMYGKVEGVMTEQTPFHPYSKKGEIRAQIATIRALRRLLWPPSPARHPQCSGVRQVGQGRESELACQRFCEAFVHLHAGRRAESGATGGERKRLESNMARSYCSRSADRETVH